MGDDITTSLFVGCGFGIRTYVRMYVCARYLAETLAARSSDVQRACVRVFRSVCVYGRLAGWLVVPVLIGKPMAVFTSISLCVRRLRRRPAALVHSGWLAGCGGEYRSRDCRLACIAVWSVRHRTAPHLHAATPWDWLSTVWICVCV